MSYQKVALRLAFIFASSSLPPVPPFRAGAAGSDEQTPQRKT